MGKMSVNKWTKIITRRKNWFDWHLEKVW